MPTKIERKFNVKSDKPQKRKNWQPAIIATLIGSVITALIGLIGVIIAAYLSYLSSSRSVEITIEATKTANSESTLQGSSVLGVQIPQAGPLPTIGRPIVPDIIDAYAPNAIEEINKAIKNGEISSWPISGFRDDSITLDIENKSVENKWIRLDNFVKINVDVLSNIPKDIFVIGQTWGKGPADYYKFAPEINLMGAHTRYSQTVYVSGDNSFDYYSLQPGEFTEFEFNLKCKQPGSYRISFEIPYRYNNKNDFYLFTVIPLYICPQKESYTKVDIDYSNTIIDRYLFTDFFEWDGNAYIWKDDYLEWNGDTYILKNN